MYCKSRYCSNQAVEGREHCQPCLYFLDRRPSNIYTAEDFKRKEEKMFKRVSVEICVFILGVAFGYFWCWMALN